MRAEELTVLFVVVDNVGDPFLLVETLLVNRVLGEVRLDHVELSDMSGTVAVILKFVQFFEVLKVRGLQFRGSLVEESVAHFYEFFVLWTALSFGKLRVKRCVHVPGLTLSADPVSEFGLKLWLLLVFTLRDGSH